MEGEVGPQVAGPVFIHQAIPTRFPDAAAMAKKRNFPWANTSCHQPQHLPLNDVGYPGSSANWNPKAWGWDSVMFVAKPVGNEHQRPGNEHQRPVSTEELANKERDHENLKQLGLRKNTDEDEDAEDLTLKLGGGLYSVVDDSVGRPNKRVRSGSPNSSYPACQVDDCKADLSNAKDYHRRHKVCEVHSKTTKALVGKQMQRFCQQCSRFHPLQEFDEGKRSCRRRLAGHNRRRRKTQPEDVSSQLLLSGGRENGSSGNLDLVNLLAVLARLPGNNADKTSNGLSLPDKDHFLQILSKINSLPVPGKNSGRFPVPGNIDLNVKGVPQSSEHASKVNGSQASTPSDFLAILSAAVAASCPGSQFPSNGTNNLGTDDNGTINLGTDDNGKHDYPMTRPNFQNQTPVSKLQNNSGMPHPLAGLEESKSFLSPDVSERPVRPSRPSVPLQLFISSPEDDSPSRMGSSRKYFSSDSSNPIEERSHSSSPVVQKLFPLHSAPEKTKHEKMSNFGDNSSTVETCQRNSWSSPLNLFKGVNGRTKNGVDPGLSRRGQESSSPVRQLGYTSSSGSDHSPSSSNSDAQDRTGRIILKLFDKDPSDFPHALRRQILDWLSHCPSELESYIRPGCVVLTVYLSMPCLAWEKFHEDFREHVNALVRSTDSGFWRTGRFLVHTDRQLASHRDGKIRLCKSWRASNAPELVYASPLAVVSGQEASICLMGRNLRVSGTRIHCTYMGGYTSTEVPENSSTGSDDEFSSISFSFPGGTSILLGRCFIEVENGFKGNCFPVIIADSEICKELTSLEPELEQGTRRSNVISDDQMQGGRQSSCREDILHFLNELGWLFQRKSNHASSTNADFSCNRFKHLLVFCVERDWTTLVKTLLDILMERNLEKKGVMEELMQMLSEIQLLNQAVKRRCVKMVTLLLHYRRCRGSDCSMDYLFAPNSAGPGGVTPLHLAACAGGSEDVVDALTNDPQIIGLNAWTSALDASGLSPYGYALMKNHHSYNKLVQRKYMDKANDQVSISVASLETSPMEESWIVPDSEGLKPSSSQKKSCTRCSIAASRRPSRLPGGRGLLHRPYLHSVLAIAAVCVCVCILCRGHPQLGSVEPFKWENISYGWL